MYIWLHATEQYQVITECVCHLAMNKVGRRQPYWRILMGQTQVASVMAHHLCELNCALGVCSCLQPNSGCRPCPEPHLNILLCPLWARIHSMNSVLLQTCSRDAAICRSQAGYK